MRFRCTGSRKGPFMKYGFGVDLGGTTVKLAYFDQTGEMLHKWEIPTVVANQGEQILPDIAAAIKNYLKETSQITCFLAKKILWKY